MVIFFYYNNLTWLKACKGGVLSVPEEEIDMYKNVVSKSNRLIEAIFTHRLTAREQKIIIYLVSKIQPDDTDFKPYSLPIKAFSQMLGYKGKPKYEELREITKKLLGKVIEIQRGDKLLQTHWLSDVEYNSNKGTIEFSFHPKMKPYLLQLKREFTTYKLVNIMQLKSGYSIRFYELLKQWERVKKTTYSLEEIREKIGIKGKYKEYSNFKLRVIDPAYRELKEKTDISFEYEPIKKGRSVTHIRFHIKKNGESMPLEHPSEEDQEVISTSIRAPYVSGILCESKNDHEMDLLGP